MSIEIRINAENAEEAQAEMRKLLGVPGAGVQAVMLAETGTRLPPRQADEPATGGQTEEPKKRGRKKAETAQISTGEERVGPEDDEATQAQDAADEAAEVEATREPEKPLTIDDLRGAMGGYVNKFGMEAAQADGVKVFADALGAPPAGNDYWKMSVVAETGGETLAKAVAAWRKAADATGRYGA